MGLATDALAKGALTAVQALGSVVWFGTKLAAMLLEDKVIKHEHDLADAEVALEMADRQYAGVVDGISVWERLLEALDAAAAARAELAEAWTAMARASEQVSAILEEGEQIRKLRESARTRAANNISKMRYSDMFFRQVRNETLAQYEAAFAAAKRHAFLAAKAYGYETGSALDGTDEGRALLREIIAARTLGETDGEGNPIVSAHGDGGLASALAKMEANWQNLKPQLGLNNPQPYATWFSLRHGLFRILKDQTGDEAWKRELAKHWTDDVRTHPEFARYCQPFASQFGTADKEPGLVIPFSTSIDFAYNLFGKPLAFGDAQFDSTWYATKIAAAGVWFEGYNEKAPGWGGAAAFAATPNVYLVPAGTDVMRVPGTGGETAAFEVIDQAIPVPYPLTAAELAEAGWAPGLGGEVMGADAETRLRKHPSFRAYYGARGERPGTGALDATRLTGRSVWNTRWLLVIPAGTLNADREGALKAFIHGLDANRDGKLDVLPVSDIQIGFRTYSVSGK